MKLVEVAHNVPDAEGNTPAHLAAAEGHLDCLRLLVYYKNEPAEVIGARNDKVSQNRCTKAARVYSKVVFVFCCLFVCLF